MSPAAATAAPALPLPAPYGPCPHTPPPAYLRAARTAPVTRSVLPDGSPCWLVTGYREVRAGLADARFSADARVPGFPFLSPAQRLLATARPSFIRMDDPEHARLRRMVTKDFLVKRVDALRPGIQAIVEEAVDRMLAKGAPADLVAEFALPVPSLVICLMLGVPYEDHGLFQSLSRTLLDNTLERARIAAAHRDLMAYLTRLAAHKERHPGDDILSRLVAREDLSAQETASLGFLLLVTGHESTATMTSVGTLALLRHPDQAALLREHPERVPGAVEELLRQQTIIHLGLGRVTRQEVELGGVRMRAGEGVIFMLSTANLDEELFGGASGACPAELDVTRDARRHLAFGFGIHQCLGQALARAELQIVLETLLRRLPTLRLAVPEEDLRFTPDSIVYGLRSLPVAW